MKTLYIECNMGAAGDMLMAALLELIEDKEAVLNQLNKIMPQGVGISAEPDEKCGVTGTHIHVTVHGEEEGDCEHHHHHEHGLEHHHHHHDDHHDHDHGHHDHAHSHEHHHHSGLSDIYAMIDVMEISEKVRKDAKAVYQLIAEAESKVHGKTMDQIHFHEVGTLDAVADVVGNCMLMDKIGADRIVVSPIHVGSGSVKCAHGLLPVPAPATALILEGMPVYGGEIKGELCTPTGAALLKYFADAFETMPAMSMEKIGYGMGTKNFDDRPNCVRVILGEGGVADTSAEAPEAKAPEKVTELAANIDDMTAEDIGFAMEVLLEAGALDVYCEHITMKKSRPAVKLVCMCRRSEKESFARLVLKHTTTLGVRASDYERFTLARHTEKRQTPWGEVPVKVSSGYGVSRVKAEADRLAEIARENNLSLTEIKKEVYK